MKKFAKVLCLMAVVLCMGFTLAACGADVEGVYECSDEGVTITLELKDDNFTMKMTVAGTTTDAGSGTYKVDGDKITLTIGAQSITGTVKDGNIVIALDEGVESTFVKK